MDVVPTVRREHASSLVVTPGVAPGVDPAVGSASGLLPLVLGGESAAGPAGEGVRVIPVDTDDRELWWVEARVVPVGWCVVLALRLIGVGEFLRTADRFEELRVPGVRHRGAVDVVGRELLDTQGVVGVVHLERADVGHPCSGDEGARGNQDDVPQIRFTPGGGHLRPQLGEVAVLEFAELLGVHGAEEVEQGTLGEGRTAPHRFARVSGLGEIAGPPRDPDHMRHRLRDPVLTGDLDGGEGDPVHIVVDRFADRRPRLRSGDEAGGQGLHGKAPNVPVRMSYRPRGQLLQGEIVRRRIGQPLLDLLNPIAVFPSLESCYRFFLEQFMQHSPTNLFPDSR